MIRYICNSYLKYPWMTRAKVFFPSLDRLVDLSNEASIYTPKAVSPTVEFSRIMQNLKIHGVWKWTGHHRLKDMDRLLSIYVAEQKWEKLHMLDVGASDGTTTFDTLAYLSRENKIPVAITIAEKDIRLLCVKKNRATIYFNSSRQPILIRFGRMALCLEQMEGIEGIVFNRLASLLKRRYIRMLQYEDFSASRTISLINPSVSRCPAIEVCEKDLFNPEMTWFCRYDVVRASNVFNLSYYSEQKIRIAIGILYQYLKEGGVLLVSRNLIGRGDEKEIGGLWTKKGTGFARISCLDGLPEIAGMIDHFRFSLQEINGLTSKQA